jgi:hypothetical protein
LTHVEWLVMWSCEIRRQARRIDDEQELNITEA